MSTNFTPKQYIEAQITLDSGVCEDKNQPLSMDELLELYSSDDNEDDIYDARDGFREGSFETKIRAPRIRYYESKSVAALCNGVWVGWTYYYGGGKHGEPQSIDWMEDAYFLDVKEEQKMVTIQTFTKKD